MKFTQKSAVLLLGSLLTAGLITGCGGGGGGGSAATPVDTTPDPVDNTPDPDPEPTPVTSTADIVVPANFNINDATNWTMVVDLSLDLTNNGGEAFVSVCSAYTGTSPNFDIDYNDCLISETTDQADFDKSVSVSTSVDSVVLAVWFPSSSDPENSAVVQEFTGLSGANATVSYTQ